MKKNEEVLAARINNCWQVSTWFFFCWQQI